MLSPLTSEVWECDNLLMLVLITFSPQSHLNSEDYYSSSYIFKSTITALCTHSLILAWSEEVTLLKTEIKTKNS